MNECSQKFGPYDRDALVVAFDTGWGMEYSGIITVDAESFFADEPADFNKTLRNVMHEVGHLWFYDGVGNLEFREGWIGEGFATYLASDEFLKDDLESWRLLQAYDGGSQTAEEYAKSCERVNKMTEGQLLTGRSTRRDISRRLPNGRSSRGSVPPLVAEGLNRRSFQHAARKIPSKTKEANRVRDMRIHMRARFGARSLGAEGDVRCHGPSGARRRRALHCRRDCARASAPLAYRPGRG